MKPSSFASLLSRMRLALLLFLVAFAGAVGGAILTAHFSERRAEARATLMGLPVIAEEPDGEEPLVSFFGGTLTPDQLEPATREAIVKAYALAHELSDQLLMEAVAKSRSVREDVAIESARITTAREAAAGEVRTHLPLVSFDLPRTMDFPRIAGPVGGACANHALFVDAVGCPWCRSLRGVFAARGNNSDTCLHHLLIPRGTNSDGRTSSLAYCLGTEAPDSLRAALAASALQANTEDAAAEDAGDERILEGLLRASLARLPNGSATAERVRACENDPRTIALVQNAASLAASVAHPPFLVGRKGALSLSGPEHEKGLTSWLARQ